jgi:hypothetical protein
VGQARKVRGGGHDARAGGIADHRSCLARARPAHATIANAFLDTVARTPDALALRTLDDASR